MLVINFAHKMNIEQLEAMADWFQIDVNDINVVDYRPQFNNNISFDKQADILIRQLENGGILDSETPEKIVVALPALSSIAVIVIVQLFAKIDRFPKVIRYKPRMRVDTDKAQFDFEEIVDLQTIFEKHSKND